MQCPRFGRVCSNSRSTLGLDSRHPRADVIHYSTRRCSYLCVLVADITFTRGHANAYSHEYARANTPTCNEVPRHPPSCSLRTRDTAEVMREPGRIVPVRLYYATSPRFTVPFSPSTLLSLCLSSSRVFAKSAFLSPQPDSLVSLYTFMHLITTVWDCVVSRDRRFCVRRKSRKLSQR